MKKDKGITLIALVITIIVLLILAGVIINILTEENGILQKAGDSKEKSLDTEIEEEIRLAWNKVYSDNVINNYTESQKADALKAELEGNKPGETVTVSANGSNLNITYRGKDKVLDISTVTVKNMSKIAKIINAGTVFNEDNTPMTDEYGNTFIIPKGFKLSKDSAEFVTEGIVIEDATYPNTLGSEFVWVPVSKNNNKIVGPAYSGTDKIAQKEVTINLGRYTFKGDGSIDVTKIDGSVITDNSLPWITFEFIEENLRETGNKNAVAKDINSTNGFISKATKAGGFWLGRYEARKSSLDNLTEVSTDNVYNNITQPNAAIASREMYNAKNYFESDLINSYAWDTATLFLQEFGSKKYSKRTSINASELKTKGTVLELVKDNPCKIFDMASNCTEWSTETCSKGGNVCVNRGGLCNYTLYCTSSRFSSSNSSKSESFSFRPILYIK